MSAEEEFADLKFRVECSQMELTKAGGDPLVVQGPGEIWQDEEGSLQYKIFADQAGYNLLHGHMARPVVVGQLFPDDDYFNLQAQDYSQTIWTASRIIPNMRGGFFVGLVHGHLSELYKTEASPPNQESAFITLRFRSKLVFPCNQGTEIVVRVGGRDRRRSSSLNAAFFDDGENKFEAYHEGEHTVVSLQLPADQLNASTPSRIHEAFQFVLARQLALMVLVTSAGGQRIIRLISPSSGNGMLEPPLQFQKLERGGHVWRMFSNYFRYVHPNAEPGWHPISRHIASAIESTAASLETRVLALAVAVEGLAGDCFRGLAPLNPAFLADLDTVLAAMQGIALSEPSRNRINGSLNAMRSPRNSDVLRAFIAGNRLPIGLYDSWSRLRNTSAHGGGGGGRDIETILRLKDEVLSLLYCLVFATIGYHGPRTDYGLTGWPQGEWPNPPEPENAPPPSPPGPRLQG